MEIQKAKQLIKGPLRPPLSQPSSLSYTQKPSSKTDLAAPGPKDRDAIGTSSLSDKVVQW